MQKITYMNFLGQSIVLNGSPFILSKVEGLGDVGADVQRQKAPFQDGSTYIDSILNERLITFELAVMGDSPQEVQTRRAHLASVINPKLGEGLLTYENDSGLWEINATPESVPVFPSGNDNRGSTFQKALVTLICPSSYWRSPVITEEPAFEPLFQFPFEGVLEMGMQRDQRVIVNDGDAPAPINVEFYGPAVNPIITNLTTGEYIKVNRTLNEGEFMRIDTTRGKKSVEFVAPDGTVTNVFNWIDLESTFFQLVIGENQIEYSADSDIQGAIVNIRYNKLYTAV